jgi:uncharacterized protein (DUF983 family)
MNSFVHSVVHNKCPNCGEGDFFEYRTLFNWYTFDKMHKSCSKCGMDFRQEPGFYFGAAIMSYVIQAVLLGLTFVVLQVIVEIPFWYFLGAFTTLLIVLVPFTFRLSRLLWINMLGTRPK